MLKGLLRRIKGGGREDPSLFEPRMPEVELGGDPAEVFRSARLAAAGASQLPGTAPGRHVVIVTPGRILLLHPCPPPGSMPEDKVAGIRKMTRSDSSRNIVSIAFTDLAPLQADLPRTIPFIGILIGFAYVGHSVWVFEGHASALAQGCREADVLIVDGAMVPFLRPDWLAVASGAMRHRDIYIHDRASFSIRPAAAS